MRYVKQCLIYTEELAKQKDKRKYLEEKLKEAGFDLNKAIDKKPASQTELFEPKYYNSYVYYQE